MLPQLGGGMLRFCSHPRAGEGKASSHSQGLSWQRKQHRQDLEAPRRVVQPVRVMVRGHQSWVMGWGGGPGERKGGLLWLGSGGQEDDSCNSFKA